ncbi:MAG: CHAT domain-containing protein [Bacteroidales bacterium]|nr:CHAT domain-containing protein [Bacteroidales bacterium]
MKKILALLFLLFPLIVCGQSKEADSLYNEGMNLYKTSQSHLAVPYLEKSDSLEKAQLDPKSPNYYRSELAIILCWESMVNNYRKNREYAEAIKYQTLVVKGRKKINGKKHKDYINAKDMLESLLLFSGQSPEADVYYNKGIELYETKQAHLAIPYLEKSDSIEKSQSPKNYRSEIALIVCWDNLRNYNLSINDISEVIRLQTLIINSLKKMEGKKHKETIEAQNELIKYRLMFSQCPEADKYYEKGINLYKTHQAHLAIPYFEKSDSIEKSKSPKFHRSELQLIQCWHDLAGYYADINDTTEAIRLQALATTKSKKLYGAKHQAYLDEKKVLKKYNMLFSKNPNADFFYNLGMEYYSIPLPVPASTYFTKSDSLEKLTLKPSSPNYNRSEKMLIQCWWMLGNYFSHTYNYDEAIKNYTLALEHSTKINGEEHEDNLTRIQFLAYIHSNHGNHDEELRLRIQAVEICRKHFGEESDLYLHALSNLASTYKRIGNDVEAIRLGNLIVDISRKKYGEEHKSYYVALKQLADYYQEINNYEEAVKFQTLAVEVAKKVFGEDNAECFSALNTLARYKSENGDYDEAIRICNILLEKYKNAVGKESEDYADMLNYTGIYHTNNGNYTEAIRLFSMALEIYKKLGIKQLCNRQLNNIAHLYFKIGNYAEALRYKILEKEYHSNSINDVWYYMSLADYYLAAGQKDKAEELAKQSYSQIYTIKTEEISEKFAYLSNKARANFWKEYSDFYSRDLPRVAYVFSDSTLAALAYNGQVFAKGFLLNSELSIQQIFEQKGNSVLVERYNKLKQDRATLDDIYKIPAENRAIDADSLAKALNNEEHILVGYANELGSYTKNLLIDWRDIQHNLKAGDLAIEFANFKDTTTKQTVYVALVLKKGMTAPEIVKLYESDSFHNIMATEYYTTKKLYTLIWQPLSKHLKGVENVYFSPCGQFHTIGIEYLPDESGKIFAEKFNVYRLSSTRELALSKEINPNKKAATYGGIKYDSDSGDGNVRNVATYLKGSKIESDSVAKLLRSADFSVIALSETLATEESFKNLSGKNLKILHIGTHGFYYSENDLENAGFSFFSNNQQSQEDKALSCSGLLFAGANFALGTQNRNALVEGDDGILTAKEISRLDFRGLDLVVLSACQTGLGEVTGEGVFGLQRGFKKAGAQTIIMSLWNVDDYATRLLMTEFFKGLTSGKTKREAFLSALKFVKAKNSNPKYWAAFVMVDGKE